MHKFPFNPIKHAHEWFVALKNTQKTPQDLLKYLSISIGLVQWSVCNIEVDKAANSPQNTWDIQV